MKLFRTLVILFAVSGVVGTVYAQDSPSKFGGEIRALNYAYGVAPNTPALTVDMPNGPSTAGATSTITLVNGTVKLSDGVVIAPLAVGVPVIIGTGSNADTVTPTSVNCSTPTVVDSCSFTATSITHAHGTGDRVTSATVGLAEAVAYATTLGGVVEVDGAWYKSGGTTAIENIAIAALPANVAISDNSTGSTILSQNVTAAAPGQVRAIAGSVTTSNSAFSDANSSIVGVRGMSTIPSGTNASGGYTYGVQGKLILKGTSSSSIWGFGLLGQLDISAATLTGGAHISPLWSDAGATAPSGTCSFCDGMVLTNTTAATYNSVIFTAARATYFLDGSNTTYDSGWLYASSASSACTTTYLLKINTPGGAGYIHVCSN